MSAAHIPPLVGSSDLGSESSQSDLPTLTADADATLAARLKDFRATTRSLGSVESLSDDFRPGPEVIELASAVGKITDAPTRMVLEAFLRVIRDLERRTMQKMAAETANLVSNFAELQDILIEWNSQTLEVQKLQKHAAARLGTKSFRDLDIVEKTIQTAREAWEPLPSEPFVTSAAKQHVDQEVNRFIYGDTAIAVHKPAIGVEQRSPNVSLPNTTCLDANRGQRATRNQDCSTQDPRGKIEQQQKTLSEQLQAHQANVCQTASQLPLWLRPNMGQSAAQKQVAAKQDGAASTVRTPNSLP